MVFTWAKKKAKMLHIVSPKEWEARITNEIHNLSKIWPSIEIMQDEFNKGDLKMLHLSSNISHNWCIFTVPSKGNNQNVKYRHKMCVVCGMTTTHQCETCKQALHITKNSSSTASCAGVDCCWIWWHTKGKIALTKVAADKMEAMRAKSQLHIQNMRNSLTKKRNFIQGYVF